MTRMAVLADDLTGAAEIAGIGVAHGIGATVARGRGDFSAELVVLDTDTRGMTPADAAARTAEAMRTWVPPEYEVAFKKVDSVLRGNVAVELKAMMAGLGKRRALLVAQNPSKGRTIVHVGTGVAEYRIAGVPLDRTAFRQDPEYPRMSARVDALLGVSKSAEIYCARVGEAMPVKGIVVGCAQTVEEVGHWVGRADGETLLAGGADFFGAFLAGRGYAGRGIEPIRLDAERTVMVCGSAAGYSRENVRAWMQRGGVVCGLPQDLFAGTVVGTEEWARDAGRMLRARGSVVLAIPQGVEPEKGEALRVVTAQVVREVIGDMDAEVTLMVEGGATAATIVEMLGWAEFETMGNVGAGVVALRPRAAQGVLLVMKPGSYPWPAVCLEKI